jgi:hypothetical protein
MQLSARAATPPCPLWRALVASWARWGVIDRVRRMRRPTPAPRVVSAGGSRRRGGAGLLRFHRGPEDRRWPAADLLTATSLHGGLVDAWALLRRTAKSTVDCLVERWRREGLPTQFDNDTVCQGARQFPDAIGRVSRLCLALGVIPLFAPPRDPGFQNAIDSTVSGRPNSGTVSIAAAKETCNNIPTVTLPPIAPATPNAASRPQSANPSRYASPSTSMCLCAVVIYLRRTDAAGRAQLLGRTFEFSAQWLHRLVRCEVDLTRQHIQSQRPFPSDS